MLVREIGEFGLIRRLTDLILRPDPRVIVGIGDDAAVVSYDGSIVLTTDTLVEGVHFRDDWIDRVSLGYKALTASLSDVAAMGGRPMHALVSLALPATEQVEQIESIYRGMAEASDEFAVTVVGGDVVSTGGPLVITVTVTGVLMGAQPLRRSGAKPGDLVFVTGDVGGAAAYVHLMQSNHPVALTPADQWQLQQRHTRPKPQIRAAEALVQCRGCTSLNDVSDGLSSELMDIAVASGVHLDIDGERVPILPAVRRYARLAQKNPFDFALHGGEDYQLVGTVTSLASGMLLPLMEAYGVRITLIGRVVDDEQGVDLLSGGGRETLLPRGYDHFAAAAGGGDKQL